MALAGCLSAFFSPFAEIRSYRHIIFGWLVLSLAGAAMKLLAPERALRLMLAGLSIGLVSSAAWALLASFFGFPASQHIMQTDIRLMLFTGYPATLGLTTGFTLTGLFFFWVHKRVVISRRVDFCLMVGVFSLLILSQARVALLGFAGAAVLTLLWASRRPLRSFTILLLVSGCLLAGAVLLGQHSTLKNYPAYQRMIVLFTDPMKDHSVVGRLGLWEAGWGVFKEHPLTGTGMRMFKPMGEKYLEEHKDELLAKYNFVESNGVHAHNLVLGVLSEMGLAGFIPLLLMVVLILRGAKYATRGSDRQCLLMFFFFFFCEGCVDYMMNKLVYSDLFFACIGMYLAGDYFRLSAQASPQASPDPF